MGKNSIDISEESLGVNLAQSAVSLSPDILAVIEKTRIEAEEELSDLGEYPILIQEQNRSKYTIIDLIDALKSANNDMYTSLANRLSVLHRIGKDTLNFNENGCSPIFYNILEITSSDKDIIQDKLELIKMALDVGIDLNLRTVNGQYPIEFTEEQVKIIRDTRPGGISLLQRLANGTHELLKIYSEYFYPNKISVAQHKFNEAVKKSKINDIQHFVDTGNGINVKDIRGNTILYKLVEGNYRNLIDLALEAGANPTIEGEDGISSIDYLRIKRGSGIDDIGKIGPLLDKLVKKSQDIKKIQEISDVVISHGMQELGNNIRRSQNIEARDENLETAFMKAVKSRNFMLMKSLHLAGADISATDTQFDTPLMKAIYNADTPVIEVLLDMMSLEQIEKRNQFGRDAKQMTIELGLEDIGNLIDKTVTELRKISKF